MKSLEEKVDGILEKDTPASHFKGMRGWVDDAEKAYKAGNMKMTKDILLNLQKNIMKSIGDLGYIMIMHKGSKRMTAVKRGK